MPVYANTHSLQSASGKQTVFAREEARRSIKQYINATENDALIFVGAGATAASNLFINKLKVKNICADVKLRQCLSKLITPEQTDLLMQEKSGAVADPNFCKQNRWMSYDCTLCKVIMPSLGAYEQHA
jgi:hypothetical protein